jgi:uncharacterized membrane protein YeiH
MDMCIFVDVANAGGNGLIRDVLVREVAAVILTDASWNLDDECAGD